MKDEFRSLAGKRVLIVDDSPHITMLLRDVFGSCGATVAVANSGRDAMVQLQVDSFDLMLLDLVMPEPDGWEVLRFARQIKPDLLERTVLLTGDRYNRHTVRDICDAELPAVFKPFALDDLRAAACDTLFRAETCSVV